MGRGLLKFARAQAGRLPWLDSNSLTRSAAGYVVSCLEVASLDEAFSLVDEAEVTWSRVTATPDPYDDIRWSGITDSFRSEVRLAWRREADSDAVIRCLASRRRGATARRLALGLAARYNLSPPVTTLAQEFEQPPILCRRAVRALERWGDSDRELLEDPLFLAAILRQSGGDCSRVSRLATLDEPPFEELGTLLLQVPGLADLLAPYDDLPPSHPDPWHLFYLRRFGRRCRSRLHDRVASGSDPVGATRWLAWLEGFDLDCGGRRAEWDGTAAFRDYQQTPAIPVDPVHAYLALSAMQHGRSPTTTMRNILRASALGSDDWLEIADMAATRAGDSQEWLDFFEETVKQYHFIPSARTWMRWWKQEGLRPVVEALVASSLFDEVRFAYPEWRALVATDDLSSLLRGSLATRPLWHALVNTWDESLLAEVLPSLLESSRADTVVENYREISHYGSEWLLRSLFLEEVAALPLEWRRAVRDAVEPRPEAEQDGHLADAWLLEALGVPQREAAPDHVTQVVSNQRVVHGP